MIPSLPEQQHLLEEREQLQNSLKPIFKPPHSQQVTFAKKKSNLFSIYPLAKTMVKGGDSSELWRAEPFFLEDEPSQVFFLVRCFKALDQSLDQSLDQPQARSEQPVGVGFQNVGAVSTSHGNKVVKQSLFSSITAFQNDDMFFFNPSSDPAKPTRSILYSAKKMSPGQTWRMVLHINKLDEGTCKDALISKVKPSAPESQEFAQTHFFDHRLVRTPSTSQATDQLGTSYLNGLFLVTENKLLHFLARVEADLFTGIKHNCRLVEVCEADQEVISFGFDQSSPDQFVEREVNSQEALGHSSVIHVVFRSKQEDHQSYSYFIKLILISATLLKKPVEEVRFQTVQLGVMPISQSVPRAPSEVLLHSGTNSLTLVTPVPATAGSNSSTQGSSTSGPYEQVLITIIGVPEDLTMLGRTINSSTSQEQRTFITYEVPKTSIGTTSLGFLTGGNRVICKPIRTADENKLQLVVCLKDGSSEIFEFEVQSSATGLVASNRRLRYEDGQPQAIKHLSVQSYSQEKKSHMMLIIRDNNRLDSYSLERNNRQ